MDTVTTGKDGTAKSKELYLGKYEVKEITAPYGMVLNEEVHSVELVYAGQNVDVTETATSFYNERQHVEIDLIKSLAIDEAYGIGKNGEIFDVTFGLYAAEELTAADGKTIPADGLIEVISLMKAVTESYQRPADGQLLCAGNLDQLRIYCQRCKIPCYF